MVPTDRIGTKVQPISESVQDMIADALKNRTDLQEQNLVLQTSELSRKTARNALLPALSVYGFYAGQGLGGQLNPVYYDHPFPRLIPPITRCVEEGIRSIPPEYQVGLQLSVPLRNRVAKADQYRAELEYRQSQVGFEEARRSAFASRCGTRVMPWSRERAE